MAENVATKEWQPKFVAIVCNCTTRAPIWRRIQYPTNVRIIQFLHGTNQSLYIVKALQTGADGVLVSG